MVVLPAPFGPEEAEHLARADLEVDPAHRLEGAVALAKPSDPYRGAHAHRFPSLAKGAFGFLKTVRAASLVGPFGGVPEWLNGAVSKTVGGR